MAPNLFPDLPDDTRAWVFALEGNPGDCRDVLRRVELFMETWVSHGRGVTGQATLMRDSILIICGLVPGGLVSGCSIDSLTRAVTQAARETGCKLVSPMKIGYEHAEGQVTYASRPEFRQLLHSGQVTSNTPVFNPAVNQLSALRAGKFEQPLAQSPFARTFRV